MQHANDIIDIVFVDRQASMLSAANLQKNVIEIVFDIDADELVSGDKNVVDCHAFEIKDVH